MSKLLRGILVVVFGVAACAGVTSVIEHFYEKSDDFHGYAHRATAQAKTAVKDRLKSPATAVFSDEYATHEGLGIWVVSGTVDSQNNFGAMVRATWVVRASYYAGTGDPGTWKVTDVKLIQRD